MISIIAMTIFAALFTLFALFLALTFKRNVEQEDTPRKKYALIIKGLRMNSMLKALKINIESYLHKVPLIKINQSMEKCETCKTTDLCDEGFKDRYINVESINYCPNQESLTHFKNLEKKDKTKIV